MSETIAIGQDQSVTSENDPFYNSPSHHAFEDHQYRSAGRVAQERVREAEDARSSLLMQAAEATADQLLGLDVSDSLIEELEDAADRYHRIARRYGRAYEYGLADYMNLLPRAHTVGDVSFD